jgi:glycosyltransferase involved in cell wall biosynthesis
VQRASGPVDLIHATGVAMPPHSAPLVLTVHDLAYLHDPDAFTARGLRFFHAALDLALEQADLVLCSSEATAADCRAAGFDERRLRVVPLGVRCAIVSGSALVEVRARYGLERPFVLWAGTVEPRKNLPVVVEAFRLLGRADLDLVLAGPAGWNVDLDRVVRPIASQVRVPGFLPRARLDALYAAAEVFCFPSLREGFGLPVAEAMAQGTPVVTSAGTATEEVAGDAALLVDPHDPHAVADALAAALDDRALRTRLRRAGRARAAELSWANSAQHTFKAYAEVSA